MVQVVASTSVTMHRDDELKPLSIDGADRGFLVFACRGWRSVGDLAGGPGLGGELDRSDRALRHGRTSQGSKGGQRRADRRSSGRRATASKATSSVRSTSRNRARRSQTESTVTGPFAAIEASTAIPWSGSI